MKPGQTDSFTEFGSAATGRCCCCSSGASEIFVFPVDLITRVICSECVRGAVMAVAKETLRRLATTPTRA